MSNLLITRTENNDGTYRYTQDGVVHTAKSKRLYTHYSAVRVTNDVRGHCAPGQVLVWLHARADLAAKSNAFADYWVGSGQAIRLPAGEITPA